MPPVNPYKNPSDTQKPENNENQQIEQNQEELPPVNPYKNPTDKAPESKASELGTAADSERDSNEQNVDELPPVNPYKNPESKGSSESEELPPVNPYKVNGKSGSESAEMNAEKVQMNLEDWDKPNVYGNPPPDQSENTEEEQQQSDSVEDWDKPNVYGKPPPDDSEKENAADSVASVPLPKDAADKDKPKPPPPKGICVLTRDWHFSTVTMWENGEHLLVEMLAFLVKCLGFCEMR